jgi:hypothetical protein
MIIHFLSNLLPFVFVKIVIVFRDFFEKSFYGKHSFSIIFVMMLPFCGIAFDAIEISKHTFCYDHSFNMQ